MRTIKMGFFSGKRVLVTGASGLIGSHLVRRLLDDGARVFSMQHVNPVQGIPCIGDIANYEQVLDMVYESCPEFVFHLAAQAIVTTGEDLPRLTLETNVLGAMNLLSALRLYNEQNPDSLHGVIV